MYSSACPIPKQGQSGTDKLQTVTKGKAVMAENTTLVEYNGISVYSNDIELITEEYISQLPDSDMIYKSPVFSGLLECIYKRYLKHVVINNKPYGYDYDVLNSIFYNIYIPLCGKYGISPTVVQFSSFVKVAKDNFTDVATGYYSNGSRVRPERIRTVKNWFNTCEAGLLGKAVNDNGVGAIFALKANYGYRDNTTLTIEQGQAAQHESAEQIAARHAAAQLPEKPDLDE